jgi:hypothetical protein
MSIGIGMDVQDHEMSLMGQDLVDYALDLLAQGTDEENSAKLHLGQILGIVARAVQEDKVQSFARQASWWANGNLDKWKAK